MEIRKSDSPDNSSNQLLNYFKNKSLTCNSSKNNFNNLFYKNNYTSENAAKLGIVIVLLIFWILIIKILSLKNKNYFKFFKLNLKNILITIFNIFIWLTLGPPFVIFLLNLLIYRKIINILLKINLGDKYRGLLDGSDFIWSIEDATALSVINVLCFLELDYINDEYNIINNIKLLLKKRLLSSRKYDKLFYQRIKKYGYYYWRKYHINIDDHVKFLDDNHDDNCDGSCDDINGEYLRNIINDKCNNQLPIDNTTNWEIYVGNTKCCKLIDNKNFHDKINIPLLFRIHHSVGDGVALLRLLIEAISDANNTIKYDEYFFNYEKILSSKIHSNIIYYSNNLLTTTMPFSPTFTEIIFIIKFISKIIAEFIAKILISQDIIFDKIQNILKYFFIIISIPSCVINQTLKNQNNKKYKLSGEKLISCWMENQDDNLILKIRDIKNISGTKFSDVIITAITSNIHKYFYQAGEIVSKKLTIVVPLPMSQTSKQLNLNNNFSVGIMPLCISSINKNMESFNLELLLRRLKDVSESSKNLKNNFDYIINYWILKWLITLLPEYLLRIFIQSKSSMIFSNLPGPIDEITIMGKRLKKIAFLVPNRGYTGIGFSCLTYNGNLNLSVIVDKAIISNNKILDEIIRGSINDIKKLHEYYSI
ncbi:wax ester synthase/diacylglycerol acyltransferase 4-like [Aphidius gifuensis]|nr:wax ester synthase/diacylglycerol acyltransferase 4-like [Aphidius gifuensis]XP_044004989.1 wax ester synthase/diacylglycerol acyltransferase 4-like [Aphidius gifuensis]XP_044004990.1 wax ester synthase/diacylglycerol acyltransferase 4-like [Aphidius gifuensis]XP_044004991.1 wax ester synthase/diacylglycerol acyltransferase 4-like [Aphidius gifuensis]